MYIPRQRDVVFINFDPSLGSEIKKRRPAVVVTNYEFNRRTGFCYVCPISSTKRKAPLYVDLKTMNSKVSGQISVHQMRSLDFSKRNIEKRDMCEVGCFSEILERIEAFVSIEN
ncbi:MULTISPECIES: type II toxin-antitoxin system PemK/MazF family toxin [Enterococcus]|uniref:type II toxin-antitoxin system PemK/MazF family toxin n=1 Tax=Enterococcus TaxID=1350 RepID=UPI0010F62064|nr:MULTISPECIES: type II toxin-antitoxin system PemK/MazF family toxin [Enterococcus]MBX8938122.1 type II toxin-antitoxin system PemK/MazF family toxin [Enterococcus gilvus]